MRRLYFGAASLLALLICMGFAFAPFNLSSESDAVAPSLVGAWEMVESNGEKMDGENGMHVVFICSPSYSMYSAYNLKTRQFLGAGGGPYTMEGNKLEYTVDYNTDDNSRVGTKITYEYSFPDEETFEIKGEIGGNQVHQKLKRIDSGDIPLAGAWRIRERMGRDGEMRAMRRGPRKTIKILSATRFQWAAINTETKQFFGTGGGTFTFKDGKYTENIAFFSRDSTRVGASLPFNGKVEGDDWHHSGKSSKGSPIKEIWARE